MNAHETDRIKILLKSALPPTGDEVAPRDLWPEIRQRVAAEPAPLLRPPVPWVDWALAGGVALVAVAFPAAVPLFLYYL